MEEPTVPTPKFNPLPSALQAGGNILSTVIGLINQKRQNKANKELAEYTYSKDLEMWNAANLYNSPSEQMKRLKQAGLNPNLVYGSGGATTQAREIPRYQTPTADYSVRPNVEPLQMLGAYQDFRMKQAQIQTAEAEARYAERMNLYRATGLDYSTRQKALWAALMSNDYSANTNEAPTPWQKGQLTSLNEKNRKILEEIERLKADTRVKQQVGDFYMENFWIRMLQGFGIKLPSFRGK